MGKRILYVETVEIGLLDIPRTLDELGYSVYKASLAIQAQEYDEAAKERLLDAIKDVNADYVITYDFVESASEACYLSNIPYIAWVYDAPQKELYSQYAQFDSNYIFVFDSAQRQRLLDIGIKNVFYSPLAIHAKKVEIALTKGLKSAECDISFVGQLYKNDSNYAILATAPTEIKDSLEKSMEKCFLKWDGPSFHGNMDDTIASYFSSIDSNNVIGVFPFISLPFYYEAAVTSRILANRERVYILNNLAKNFDVNFYTFDKDTSQLSRDVKIHEGAKYDYEVSNIYANSKINLNITLHCIETGASQRILDCMAAGGFILSNYQADLVEMFVPGEEIAIYHDYDELVEQISYYLEHEEERISIAKRGQDRVLRDYNFRVALEKVMGIVKREEKSRRLSFINADCQFLEEKTKEVLTIEDPVTKDRELSILRSEYANPKYRTMMKKIDNFGIFFEMLNVWNIEKDYGRKCLFDGIGTVDEAEMLYHRIKFILWRIESEIDYNEASNDLKNLIDEGVSLLLIVWIIHANLQDEQRMVVTCGRMIAEFNVNASVEFLSYGAYYFPDSKEILFNKVDILLEMGLFEESLAQLRTFNYKDDEVNALIAEMEEALSGN